MAAVVSHAMRRFPPSPPDVYSSYELRGESSHQVWPELEHNESSLARSMRYANPWLYGSVRAPNALFLTPAFVLCSCSDYINGTKRSGKKSPGICKKCKGSRLPLSSGDAKFGTVRCYPTVNAAAITPTRAGTVRVTSSSSRPTILPSSDPYDLMRRSRLAPQEAYQLRARSISPSKSRALEPRSYSATRIAKNVVPEKTSSGRRSILECDINPYDLVSPPTDSTKDTSIKFMGGQRVRVRQLPSDHEYEDIQEKVKNPQPSPSPKSNKRSSPRLNEKESDANRFKSILKKPTTFSDTDTNYGTERSPSPAQRTGSHFYLPMPANVPRKKVQFLVESRKEDREEQEESPRWEQPTLIYENVPESEEVKKQEEKVVKCGDESSGNSSEDDVFRRRTCALRRSVSERCNHDTPKVVFHDTTALRTKSARNDSRSLFGKQDPERLDGISQHKGQNSPSKSRPRKAPPPPPPPVSPSSSSAENDSDSSCYQICSAISSTSPDVSETSDEGDDVYQDCSNEESVAPLPRNEATDNGTENDATSDEVVSTQVCEDTIAASNGHIVADIPVVPPRKRSNNKSSTQITSSSPVQTIKIESPVMEPPINKTVVQISPVNNTVHKIQIKNEFVETPSIQYIPVFTNAQRKTSILINGDDCYSTVNVNDDVPLYQSSVVVKDEPKQTIVFDTNKNSSSIYITGNFSNTIQCISPTTTVFTPFETKLPNVLEKESDKIIEIVDTKENVVKAEQNLPASYGPKPASAEEALEILLKDPVEAVRRNLVPHVCGKSDMSRATPAQSDKQENDDDAHAYETIAADEQKLKALTDAMLGNLRDDDRCSEHSSSTQYELMDPGSDCYTDNSNRSSVTEEELGNRTKFYELLAEAALVEVAESEDHHYESIKSNVDPIYEEIEVPPPLPSNPPPLNLLDDLQLDKEFTTRSIFEGASKYDILSYLVDAKDRVQEDNYSYSFNTPANSTEDTKAATEAYNGVSHMSTVSDSSEDSSLIMPNLAGDDKSTFQKSAEVERNDSGVGSETSKSSLSKYRTKQEPSVACEDCEVVLESLAENEPLICRKCLKRRSERKEIITEIVETEEKYSRDLQIILEEFYQPMLVAGLLTPEQLSAIFLNVEELLENSQALAERLRDAVEIAADQGDEDLLTVNIGKLFLEAAPMLHAFESYCVRQGAASLLLASLEKDKELLRIFLRVSQMENTLLRRMNLNSFLMVPVQRVTKYPLLLARLYKVTPVHHDTRQQLKEAQNKIELHLSHMNSETKDVPSKLWRRISSSSGRRSSAEMDLVNIKLRKIAVDVLEWNHEEAKFTLEGRLLYTQPTDNNWRKGRTIKLTPINALLVTNGKSSGRPERSEENGLVFSRHSGVREAALLLVRDKNGRYSLLREPLYLDRCVIAADPAWQSYFEVQELMGKDTFIFKAEDDEVTRTWYRQLQYHAQGLGTWRKRRNALANIMINGMGLRS